MTRRIFSKGLKPAIVVSSILSAGVVLSLPALAQMQTQTASDVELSSDALEILCERFPLNSRCDGGATEARGTTASPERLAPNQSDSADAVSDPSEAPVQDAPDTMPGSSYETQPSVEPGATMMPAPEGGEVAPKQVSALSKQMSETPAPSDTMAPNAAGADALAAPEPAETPAPEAASAETPAAETPAPEAASAETPAAETPAPEAASAETPAAETPAPEAVGTEASEAGTPAASITEMELQKFAEAVPQIQAIERSTQEEVAQAIEESGFSRERFGQLYQQQTSGAAIEPVPTTDEQQTFTQAYSNIEKIQQDAQTEREQVITEQGLEPRRFDQILAAVLQDPSLQQQVQNMMAQ